jgi:hypothetical protein
MGVRLLDFLAAFLPILLALVAIQVPQFQSRWRSSLIIGFGIVTSVVIWYQQQTDRDSTIDLITGRRNFFYFKADLSGARNGQVPLRHITHEMVGVSALVMISPAEAQGNQSDPRYWSFWKQPRPMIVPAGGYMSDISLPIGKWRIEFVGMNSGWDETLEIYEHNGLLAQSILVMNGKEALYTEAD